MDESRRRTGSSTSSNSKGGSGIIIRKHKQQRRVGHESKSKRNGRGGTEISRTPSHLLRSPAREGTVGNAVTISAFTLLLPLIMFMLLSCSTLLSMSPYFICHCYSCFLLFPFPFSPAWLQSNQARLTRESSLNISSYEAQIFSTENRKEVQKNYFWRRFYTVLACLAIHP